MSETQLTGRTLPLMPLRGMLVFPHSMVSLEVGRERSLRAVEAAMLQEQHILVMSAQRDAQTSEPDPEEIHRIGTLVEIKQLLRLPDSRVRVLVSGLARTVIHSFVAENSFYMVEAHVLQEESTLEAETQALMRVTLRELEQYLRLSKKGAEELLTAIQEISAPSVLADTVAAQLSITLEERQALLEILSPTDRLERLCAVMARESEILELEKRVQARVRKQMERSQREYYLREQMKAIQKELGEKDERTAEIDEIRERVAAARLPKLAEEKALHELVRLERMPPMSAEAVVVRGYLDWILELPWSKRTKDRLDIARAEEILAREHYGLEGVKERILEFLAVRQLARKMRGPILCLVGPPGVGKTSLARSVAAALGRKFHRISLGGVRDEAEIRGHRRTYVGAMPGRILQGIKAAESRNPVLLLDEVDKMNSDYRGDPTSALLEVLDPEQNSLFGDHYLEIPFDLSEVLFITTANALFAIPRPLRDRMEVIQIPGYTELEKLQIAKRHLVPKQLGLHGLTTEHLTFSDAAVKEIITSHTREAGVRELERAIATICRKVAREIVSSKTSGVKVTRRILGRFLGSPRFHYGIAETEDNVGVATGMAYTEVGGDILSIEVTVMKGKGRLTLTGKLGEVMRESAQAAVSYVRSCAESLGIDADFSDRYDIHIHVPEGAVPKDGPSAGITIAVALASALSGRPVRKEWAMTGEITLRGRVLPIGGVKEKLLAAHRSGVSHIILPQGNERDLLEVPRVIRRQLHVELVDDMERVLELTLRPASQGSGLCPRSLQTDYAGSALRCREILPQSDQS